MCLRHLTHLRLTASPESVAVWAGICECACVYIYVCVWAGFLPALSCHNCCCCCCCDAVTHFACKNVSIMTLHWLEFLVAPIRVTVCLISQYTTALHSMPNCIEIQTKTKTQTQTQTSKPNHKSTLRVTRVQLRSLSTHSLCSRCAPKNK